MHAHVHICNWQTAVSASYVNANHTGAPTAYRYSCGSPCNSKRHTVWYPCMWRPIT